VSKVSTLQGHLEKELLGIQYKDDAEKLVRSELSNAQQKYSEFGICTVKLSEAFLVYQELMSSSLLSTQAIHLEEYQEKLDVFKTQGRTLISDKFAQIYNRKLNRFGRL